MEELHTAALMMARNKMPGKVGIPIEFYLALWDKIDPILLEVLQMGLEKGELHPLLTIRIIVLLAKRGDPLLVGNKRGLTLLNYALKILTKLYQIRLSSVLQNFMTEQ